MALDLTGYSTPVNQFEGLYKTSDDLQRQNLLKTHHREKAEANRKSLGVLVEDLTDPKKFLTATIYDPEVLRRMADTKQQGLTLANIDGMDEATLRMAIGKKVDELSIYAQNVKTVRDRTLERLALIPQNSGYNKPKLLEESLKTAFFDESGKMRDMAEVDPTKEYWQLAIQKNPLAVTDNSAFADAIKVFEPSSEKITTTNITSTGAMEKRSSLMKARNLFTYDDKEKEWVPKYEIAMDGDNALIGKFKKGGKTVDAPIRLATNQHYDNIISSNPAVADRIRGEVNEYTGGKQIDAGTERLIGRMLLYDNLKPYATGALDDLGIEKDAPIVRSSGGGGSRSSGGYGQNTATMGNEFDRFNFETKGGVSVTDGVAKRKDGTLYTGKISMTKDFLKQGTASILKSSGVNVDDYYNYTLEYKDGVLVGMTPVGGNPIDRQDMENFQLKYNSEPQKGAQPKFGPNAGNTQKPKGNNTQQSGVVKAGTIVYKNGKPVKLKRDVSMSEIKAAGFSTNK